MWVPDEVRVSGPHLFCIVPSIITQRMIDMKQFVSAIKQIAEEKGIPQETVFETVEAALAAAYKRDYGKKGQIIKVDTRDGKYLERVNK